MLKKMNLLYIEDNNLMQDLVSDLLNSLTIEFKIIIKNRLDIAIDYCLDKKNKIDIVLLDLNLPNSKGVNTFKRIYKIIGNEIPIVIVSVHTENACKCVKMGAQDYLDKKELNSNVLYRSVNYAVDRFNIQKQLTNSKNKYKRLVESTKACIYEIDLNINYFTYINDMILKQTGWTKKDLLTKPLKDFLTKDSYSFFQKRMKQLNNGKYINDTMEYEIKCKDGSTAWVLNTSRYKEIIKNDTKKIIGAFGVAINITPQKVAEQLLLEKEKETMKYLEKEIDEWNKEMEEKNIASSAQLQLISNEILNIA